MKLATLCYVRRGGRTLMLYRNKKKNDYHQGKWNGLGGKLDPGESPEECAVREVLEESGLRVGPPRLRGMITFPAFDGVDDWYTFLFTMHSPAGEPIDSPEGTLAWIDNEKLLDLNLWPGDRIFIPWTFGERFFSAKFVYETGNFVGYEVTFQGPNGELEHQPYRAVTPSASPASATFQPVYTPADDTYCWLCGGPVTKRHCKITCHTCGFVRDCSDP